MSRHSLHVKGSHQKKKIDDTKNLSCSQKKMKYPISKDALP